MVKRRRICEPAYFRKWAPRDSCLSSIDKDYANLHLLMCWPFSTPFGLAPIFVCCHATICGPAKQRTPFQFLPSSTSPGLKRAFLDISVLLLQYWCLLYEQFGYYFQWHQKLSSVRHFFGPSVSCTERSVRPICYFVCLSTKGYFCDTL